MKLETIVIMVVVVGLIFTIVGLMANDLKTQYPDVEVENLTGKYDYSSKIDNSATKIINYFRDIGEEEGGWKILTGITAIPLAVIQVVSLILSSLGYGVDIVTGLGTELGIDDVVLSFIVIMITIVIIFALIKFWRKTEPV
ncbi:MAG: hypothetical protein ACTSPV_01185 [Candidatus Hodarchaeales archaeon]